MRNNIIDARAILHDALLNAGLGIRLAYENNAFNPEEGETWGAVFYLPNIICFVPLEVYQVLCAPNLPRSLPFRT